MAGKKLNDLTTTNTVEAYKKYKSAIDIVQFGSLKFWFATYVVLQISYFVFLPAEYQLVGTQINLLFVCLIFSLWMCAKRIGYEDGFKEGYEAGHCDGARGAVKELNDFSDEDIDTIEEMESLAEAEKSKKKKRK